jgi:hypothetical protein
MDAKHPTHLSDMVSTPCCCPCELVAAVCLYFYSALMTGNFFAKSKKYLSIM